MPPGTRRTRASQPFSGPRNPEETIQATVSALGRKSPRSDASARCEVDARKWSSVMTYQIVREAKMSATSSTVSPSWRAMAKEPSGGGASGVDQSVVVEEGAEADAVLVGTHSGDGVDHARRMPSSSSSCGSCAAMASGLSCAAQRRSRSAPKLGRRAISRADQDETSQTTPPRARTDRDGIVLDEARRAAGRSVRRRGAAGRNALLGARGARERSAAAALSRATTPHACTRPGQTLRFDPCPRAKSGCLLCVPAPASDCSSQGKGATAYGRVN